MEQRTLTKQEIIDGLLSEVRCENETLMGRLHHYQINYTRYEEHPVYVESLAKYERNRKIEHHLSMAALALKGRL